MPDAEGRAARFFRNFDIGVRGWIALLIISAIVGTCCVLGVSYVAGQGWSIFNAPVTVALCVAATVAAAIILLLIDWGFYHLSTKCYVDPSDATGNSETTSEDAAGSKDADDAEESMSPEIIKEADSAEVSDPSAILEHPEDAEPFSSSDSSTSSDSAGSSEPSSSDSAGSSESSEAFKPPQPSRAIAVIAKITPSFNIRSILLFSLIMAILWLPWLIANFPGGTYWDTYYQIYQCYPENHPIAIIPYAECYDNTLTDAWLCDHHPVFDTLIYGAFAMASDALTGSWMAGVFVFVCLQGIAYVLTLTTAVAYLRARRCPVILCFIIYVFFCIMPFVSTWALCMVKDSFFGLFFIMYLIMLFEAVRTHGASLMRPRAIVLFIILGLLLCLTKKAGVYVVVPTAVIAAIACRSHLRVPSVVFLGQAVVCILVMFLLLPSVVFPLLNIAPGGRQEMLGTLFQQTARYVTTYPDEVTDEEREAIDAILEYDNLPDQYTYDFQDSVKYRYNINATTDDLINYLKTWAAQGLKHPESYLASLMSIAGFYVAPCGIVNIRMVTVDTHMGDDNRYMLYNPEELDWLRNGLDEAYDTVAHIYGLDVPVLLVVYVLWLPAALIFIACRRRLRCATLFVPAVILMAFCIISPVYDARYCIPLLDGVPLMVGMIAALLRVQHDKVRYHGVMRK